VLIGWFLSNAAMMSYRQFRIDRTLTGVKVSEVMRSGVATIQPEANVQQLVDQIMTSEQRCFPVVAAGDGALGGLACVDDVRRIPREAWDRTPVSQIMTGGSEIETMGPDEEASAALKKLASRGVGQVPVVGQGHLLGMVRREDIMKWIAFRSHEPDDTELRP
jgi:CBS domain-containing protein